MEAIMEQLQVISQQICALHQEMVHQFGAVHEHLTEIHQTICDGIVHLDSLIRNEVQGFRADAIGRLENIEENLNRTRQALAQVQQDILTQDLGRLLIDAGARLRREATDNERVRVQEVATRLLDGWVLWQSASSSLNGSCWYGIQPIMPADWLNKILCSTNYDYIQQLFGFLGRYAREHLGLDFTTVERVVNVWVGDRREGERVVPVVEPRGIAAVNLERLVHPGMFSTAVVPYLQLRQRFVNEDYIADEGGEKLNRIIEFGRNSLNFIHKVQYSRILYTNLFARHVEAIARVNTSLVNFLAQFNRELNVSLHLGQDCSIDICTSLQTIIDRFVGKRLKSPIAHGEGYNIVLTEGTDAFYTWFTIPKELVCAESLGLGNVVINFSYIMNPLGLGNYIGARFYFYYRDSSSQLQILSTNVQQNEYSQQRQLYFRGQHILTAPMICIVMGCGVNDLSTINVDYIKAQISSHILAKRKEFVAKLLHKDCAEFNHALEELDAPVNLIKAYTTLAGFPAEAQQSLTNLYTQNAVTRQLQQFILTATIATSLLQTPTEATVNATRGQVLGCIARAQNGEAIFRTPLQQLLQRRIAETGMVRTAFLEHLLTNRIRSEVPPPEPDVQQPAREPVNYAEALGIDFVEILHDYNRVTRELVNAIVTRSERQVIRFSASAEVNLFAHISVHTYTPLHIAVYIGNLQIVTALTAHMVGTVHARALINAEDAVGNTPLMLAAQRGHLLVVQHLSEIGVDIDHINDAGANAQDLARGAGHDDIALHIERIRAEHIARNAAAGGTEGAAFEQHRAADDAPIPPVVVIPEEPPQVGARVNFQPMV